MRVAIVVLFACAACSSSEEVATEPDARDAAIDAYVAPESGWIDTIEPDDADVFQIPDYGTRPDAAGWCLSRGGRHGCELGGACTFNGLCVGPDAGLDDAGVKACGAIGCDPAWCTCIDHVASTCDCTP